MQAASFRNSSISLWEKLSTVKRQSWPSCHFRDIKQNYVLFVLDPKVIRPKERNMICFHSMYCFLERGTEIATNYEKEKEKWYCPIPVNICFICSSSRIESPFLHSHCIDRLKFIRNVGVMWPITKNNRRCVLWKNEQITKTFATQHTTKTHQTAPQISEHCLMCRRRRKTSLQNASSHSDRNNIHTVTQSREGIK